MNRTAKTGIEHIEIDGLVTIHIFDGTRVQTVRSISLHVDVNGPQSAQFVSELPIEHFRDFASPYGMVDSEHPLIRQFVDRVMALIAEPGDGASYDIPPRAESEREPRAAD